MNKKLGSSGTLLEILLFRNLQGLQSITKMSDEPKIKTHKK